MVVAGLFVIATPSLLLTARDARAGRSSLKLAAKAVRANDANGARRDLDVASQRLRSASHRLGSIWVLPLRITPLVGRQVRAVRGVVDASGLIAEAGRASADVLDVQPPGGWAVRDGGIDVSSLGRAGKILRDALPEAERAKKLIDDAPSSVLLPPLHNLREKAADTIGRVVDTMRKGAAGLEAAPRILGDGGRRRYLILNANLAELRGTGGLLGFFAVMDVDRGQLKLLPKTGRPKFDLPALDPSKLEAPQWYEDAWDQYKAREQWLNVNMSPNFPEVANVITQAVSTDPGPIDGVIQIDAFGLATLLQLTGPVNIEGWPVPIGPDNVANIFHHDQYVRFTNNIARDAFGTRLIGAVFAKVTSSHLPLNIASIEKLGRAVANGHVKMYIDNPADERAMRTVGADGGYRDEPGLEFGVLNLNVGGNKIDWFLRRKVRHRFVESRALGRTLELSIDLQNTAPPTGLPDYITGQKGGDIQPGENATVLAILHSAGTSLVGVTVNGKPAVVLVGREGELRLSQMRLRIPPQGRVVVHATIVMSRAGAEMPRLLHVIRQPIPTDP